MQSELGADMSRLRAPGRIQIALGAAIAELEVRGVPDTGGIGMPVEHDRAIRERRPAGFGECSRLAKDRAQEDAGDRDQMRAAVPKAAAALAQWVCQHHG